MPYLEIVFQNIQSGGMNRINPPNSRYYYTVGFPGQVNVCQTPAGQNGALIAASTAAGGYASLGWGANITAAMGVAGGASGILFCESSMYPIIFPTHYHIGAWTATNQITSPPYDNWPSPGWNPANDNNLQGYNGYNFVNGWVAIPGWNCPAGTVPPVPLPNFPAVGAMPPLGWKITNADTPYLNWYGRPLWNGRNWDADNQPAGTPAAPASSAAPVLTNMPESFTPYENNNLVCTFLEGLPDAAPPQQAVPLAPVSPDWLQKSNPDCALQCIGTGAAAIYNGAAPPGSDRYAIYSQATNRTYNGSADAISMLFVHVKNSDADPGTQIAALCVRFPNAIILGDMNLNIRKPLVLQSLSAAVNGTHTVLAIQQEGGAQYYGTRGNSCIDYALVPNAHAQQVELWAYRPNPALAVLATNGSDHSVMMLRIYCS